MMDLHLRAFSFRVCLALALVSAATGAYANGCQPSLQSSFVCPLGDSGKPVARSTLSDPNLNVATLINPGMGPSSGRGPAFSGLRHERFALSGETGLAGAGAGSRWNAWLALGQNDVGNKFQPTQSGGHVGLTLLGVDYTFANNVVAGVAATWDRTRVTAQSLNNGTINGSGYNIAPYVSVPFGRNWLLDASIGFGSNDIDIVDRNPAIAVSGSTKSDRMFTSVALSYAQVVGKAMWTGKLSWVTNEDKIGAFTLTPVAPSGGPVAASTLRVSQLRLGGQVAYNAGPLFPYFGLTYVRDLQSPNAPSFGGQTPANDKDGWIVALGVNVFSRGALSGGVMFSTETARQQVRNDVLMANIAVRF